MKQSQLNIFTDVISRSLERPYSSLLAEPVPPRLQALLDRLALAGGPAEEQSPWIHYQRSCDCPGAMSELGGQHPRSSPRRRLRHRPAPVAALRRRQCRSARCFCQAPPPLLQPRRRQPHHRRRSLGGMEEHRDRRAAEVVHHDHHGRERLHSAGSLAHASRTRELRALALREAGTDLLKPAAADVLRMWPVSRRVNSSRAPPGDDPTLSELAAVG